MYNTIGGSKGVPGTPPGSKFLAHLRWSWRPPSGKSWIRHWLKSLKDNYLIEFPSYTRSFLLQFCNLLLPYDMTVVYGADSICKVSFTRTVNVTIVHTV